MSYPPTETYQQPTQVQPEAPPRKKGGWQKGCLACCGGCAVVTLILVIISAVWFNNQMQSVGPVDQQTVEQKLGADVPIYPGSTFDANTTRVTAVTLRFIGNLSQELQAGMKGVGVYKSDDDPDTIDKWYSEQLTAAGWTERNTGSSGPAQQRLYIKGEDGVMVQIQRQQGKSMIILFRIERANQGGGSDAPGGEGGGGSIPIN